MSTLFFTAWFLTISLELCVTLLTKNYILADMGLRKLIIGLILASTITLPVLYFIFPYFFSGFTYVLIGELFAICIEAVFYKYYFQSSSRSALNLSLLANGVSFLIGVLVFW